MAAVKALKAGIVKYLVKTQNYWQTLWFRHIWILCSKSLVIEMKEYIARK
jgi:hypothetical protein